ncbi:hypothetical protein [Tetragenococcus halophilus]|uniref:hypothetical protein n=1 Tax=Tetragenococcus halophilus TaxID=51669 RepID=UPI00300FC3BF
MEITFESIKQEEYTEKQQDMFLRLQEYYADNKHKGYSQPIQWSLDDYIQIEVNKTMSDKDFVRVFNDFVKETKA